MAKISVKVDHTLGSVEALKRLRSAAEAQRAKVAGFLNEVEWTPRGARVDGKGFSGEIQVDESAVTVDADLGFPASLMPLKVKREAEAWLRSALGS